MTPDPVVATVFTAIDTAAAARLARQATEMGLR